MEQSRVQYLLGGAVAHSVASPIGAAALTLLAAHVGGAVAIVIGGLFFVALTMLGFFTPARRRHPERVMA